MKIFTIFKKSIRAVVLLLIINLLGSVCNAKTINVKDYGILPKVDVAEEVCELIETLKDKEDITLFFPKGEYWFFPENAKEIYRSVSNHENGLRRVAFFLDSFKNFTLDGNGSTFLFHGKLNPIIIDHSKNVKLKNFTIDWNTPFHHELKVIESNPKTNSFVAEVSPMTYGFEVIGNHILFNHYNWQDELGQNVTFDTKTLAPVYDSRTYQLRNRSSTKIEKIGSNKVQFTDASKEAPKVGMVICNYGEGDDNRHAQAIHLTSSQNTLISNVRVLAAGGMALMVERCENIRLNKMIVTSREDRVLSTRADATHFLGCKGKIDVQNCLFEHMADDGINVHGAYIKVVEVLPNNTLLCEISHRQQKGLIFAQPNDKISIISRETVLPLCNTVIEKVKVLNSDRMLLTVSDLPDNLGDRPLSVENLTWYPDVFLKNNVIRNNRARSALISTKGKVLIEKNYFSSQMHGILIEGDNKSWYESGGVLDITIKDNEFVNIGYGSLVGYPLYVSPMFTDEQHLGDQKYHHGIRFNNNTIKSFNGLLVHARSVCDLEIKENKIIRDDSYLNSFDLPSVALEYCDSVIVTENRFEGFNLPLSISTKNNCFKIDVSKNKGIQEHATKLVGSVK